MSKTKWYGCLGFLSLLGLVGVLTPQREFLSFFAFAVDFEYFFLPSDEMVEQYMNRSAARGFVAGMLVMAAVTVGSLLIGQQSSPALLTGCVAGWAAAVIAQALSAAYYGFREKQGAGECSATASRNTAPATT